VWGGGVPSPEVSPPQRTMRYGERPKVLQRGPGRSLGRKWGLVCLELERTHLMAIFCIFATHI